MTTAREILTEAFGEIGILDPAEPLAASDAEFALTKLNSILDAWTADTSLAFMTTATVFNKPSGDKFTIGPAQAINAARPLRIEGSSFVRVGGLDYPLQVVDEADYNAIGLKNIGGGWPAYAWFDGGSPVGNVYFWPTGAAEIHLVTFSQIAAFPDLFTVISLPPGYKNALVYSLAEALAMPYGRPVDQRLMRAASNARRAIKTLRVPQLGIGVRGLSDRAALFGLPY